MNRLFSSLFADRRNSQKTRATATRKRSGCFQVETLEGRQLLASIFIPAGQTPPTVAAVHNAVLTDVYNGYLERNSNENGAITLYNEAAGLAGNAHDPLGLEDVALGWANLPASSWTGWAADNFVVQAIAAAQYWVSPLEGQGSGTDYAWGCSQYQAVLNQSRAVSNTLRWAGSVNNSDANSIDWLAENNQNYLLNMTEQFAPPLAAGSWQVNIGGVNVSYTLTQYVGYAYGQITANGRVGKITETSIRDMSQTNSSVSPGTLFGSAFTINWNDGTTQKGYAEQSPQNSGQMYLYFLQSNNQYVYAGTANRTAGTNWVP